MSGYQRKSTKWCSQHPEQDDCDCPVVQINVPSSLDLTDAVLMAEGAILALGQDGIDVINAEEYKRKTGQDWE